MAVPAEFEDGKLYHDNRLMQTNGMGCQDKGGVT